VRALGDLPGLVIAATVLSATGNVTPAWFEALAFASLTAGAGVTIPGVQSAPASPPATALPAPVPAVAAPPAVVVPASAPVAPAPVATPAPLPGTPA
jgi:hypothetical protein